ncbi:MAG: hypothetical protein ACRDOE_02695 [Streptosporangiaceae bacterium]
MGGTLRKALTYGAVLIGTYLVVYNYTGAGADIGAVDTLITGETGVLQGRNANGVTGK